MNELVKFKAAIDPFREGWKSIDIRAVCLRAQDKWIVLGTRLVLSSNPDPPDAEPFPEFPSFAAFRETRDIQALGDLLSQFTTGIFDVAGEQVHLVGRIEGDELKASAPFLWFQTNRRSDPWVGQGLDFPTIILGASGERIEGLLRYHPEALDGMSLDWRLRALDPPYDGLNDLLAGFVGFPKPPWGAVTDNARVELVAPIQVRFGEQCKFLAGELTVHVEAFDYENPPDISVGLIERHRNLPPRRSSHRLASGDWAKVNNLLVARRKLPAAGGFAATIFLRYGEVAIDAVTLRDPLAPVENPRMLAYGQFDQDFEALRKCLKGEGRDRSADFELGVELLLHLCGFNVGPYGRVRAIQEEIDLIAFAPHSNHVVAAECTIADLDVKEKLSKLSRRVKELGERLGDFVILPLMFTALEGGKVSESDLQKAKTEAIGVAAAEEIAELLRIAAERRAPSEALRYLYGLIPKEESPLSSAEPDMAL